jgi:glycosyltransferase involved in cell wall biosynthesis
VAARVEVAPHSLYGVGPPQKVAWLIDLIRTLDPDLVQAHWLPNWGYCAVAAAARPVVVTAWGSDLYKAVGPERLRADIAMLGAHCVLARSEHMRREMLARGVAADRIRRVDLGINLDQFRPASDQQRARVRKELGLPSGPLILSLRAATQLYNLRAVLEAFRSVRARVRDATLVLLRGDAPAAPGVGALLDRLGSAEGVWDLGHVSHADVPMHVMAADVAVSIPNSDGSPSSVWEALAGGVPLVLSDLPQIAEKVGGSGAVKLVPPRLEPVAAALVELIEDVPRRRRMAHAARAWAELNFGEKTQIERLGSTYEATVRRSVAAVRPGPASGRQSALGRAPAAAICRNPN